MKIAFLNIYRNNNRGAESFVNELAARLSAKNSVTILGPEKDTWIVQPKSTTGFLKRFFLDPSSISVLLFSLKLLPRLLKEKPDLVIPMNGFWQVVICKFLGCKILITGHSGPAWDERWNLYLKPDVFVATTEPTAVWAKKTCPWTRVVVIP
ncbi:MAG: glycosyltransferase family 4 protein, partial [archaeon]|nr:glycosyltransferase family 4 protein [archaeon]